MSNAFRHHCALGSLQVIQVMSRKGRNELGVFVDDDPLNYRGFRAENVCSG